MTGPAGGGGGSTMDPVRVRSAATKFDAAGDQLDQAHQKLEHALQAQGDCWGHDEAGNGFAKDYVPGAQGINDAIKSIVEAMHSLREQVQGAANDFEHVDTSNASDLGKSGQA